MYHVEAKSRFDVLCMNFHKPFYGKYLKKNCDAFFSIYSYNPEIMLNFEFIIWCRHKYQEYMAEGAGDEYFDKCLKGVRAEFIDYFFHKTSARTRVVCFIYIQRLNTTQLIPTLERLLCHQLNRMKEYKVEHPDEQVQIGQMQIYFPYITKHYVFTTDGKMTDMFGLIMKAYEAEKKTQRKITIAKVDRHELIRRWKALKDHDNPNKPHFPIRHYVRYFTRRSEKDRINMLDISNERKQI